MDFQLAPNIEEIRLKIHDFVKDHILPLEQDPTAHDEPENIAEKPLHSLRAKAKAEGLWSLQMPKEQQQRYVVRCGRGREAHDVEQNSGKHHKYCLNPGTSGDWSSRPIRHFESRCRAYDEGVGA